MMTAPANWEELYEARDTHMEIKIVLNGTEYYTEDLASGDCKVTHSLFNAFSFGSCNSAEFSVTIQSDEPIVLPDGIIPIELYVRLTDRDRETVTDWVPQGKFWVDSTDNNTNGDLGIIAYDTLMLADQDYFKDGAAPEGDTTWPKKAFEVVTYICTKLGCTLDARSHIPTADIEAPNYKTMREVLGEIAVMAAGNWTMTKAGKLRLVPLSGNTDASDPKENISVADLRLTSTKTTIGQVILKSSDTTKYSAGDEKAYTVEGSFSGATQELTDALLAKCNGIQYQGVTTSGAWCNPLLELGDQVISTFKYDDGTEETYPYTFDSFSLLYEEGCSGTIDSPLNTDVSHRIRYTHAQATKTSAAIKQACEDTLEAAKQYTDEHGGGGSGRYIEKTNGTGTETSIENAHIWRTQGKGYNPSTPSQSVKSYGVEAILTKQDNNGDGKHGATLYAREVNPLMIVGSTLVSLDASDWTEVKSGDYQGWYERLVLLRTLPDDFPRGANSLTHGDSKTAIMPRAWGNVRVVGLGTQVAYTDGRGISCQCYVGEESNKGTYTYGVWAYLFTPSLSNKSGPIYIDYMVIGGNQVE